MNKRLLLINPPIYDFSAYNLWARPLGLLYLSSFLKSIGFDVDYIDCLSSDYHNNYDKNNKYSIYNYYKEEVEKPHVYKSVKRYYYRFGLNPHELSKMLQVLKKPDLIMVTSIMTYWYPGVIEAISILKKIFTGTPVLLGGIYATLCKEHAVKESNADYIFTGNDFGKLVMLICRILNDEKFFFMYNKKYPGGVKNIFLFYPDYNNYSKNDYIPVLTSIGCVNKCKYCASGILNNSYISRECSHVINELEYWFGKYNINDIAFYDDALLYDSKKIFIPLLEWIIKKELSVNFHTPNGMHLKFITNRIADLMKNTGFKTLRFGLESIKSKYRIDSDNKINMIRFEKSINILIKSGFNNNQIGVYILMGLPGQVPDEVISTIDFVKSFNVKVKLCEYSPVPYTEYFYKAKLNTNADFEKEPLYQNNTTLFLWNKNFSEDCINELKCLIKK